MNSTLKGLFALIVITLFAYEATAQWPSDWNVTITNQNHTILIQNTTLVTVDGLPAQTTNCWLGVFYEMSNGDLQCGGYNLWQGVTTNITAWGADVGDDGFAAGEVFKWKILYVVGTDTFIRDGEAVYSPVFPNNSTYATNGMTGITEAHFFSALNLEAVGWAGPLTSCGLLPNEPVTVTVTNDSTGVISEPFDLSYSVDSGQTWVTETFTTTVNPGDTVDLTFTQTADFSAYSYVGGTQSDSTYNVMFKIIYANDADTTDNMFATQITNMQLPLVIASGLDTSYCCYPNSPPVQLSGVPAGGTFSGPGVQGDNMLIGPQGFPFVCAGSYEVIYNFFDIATGCMGADTMHTTVYALPEATFSGYLSLDVCQYDTIDFIGDPAGGEFWGNYVDTFTGEFAPLTPGSFTVQYAYTDEFGCYDESPIETFTVHSLPNAEFVNLQRAYCENGSVVQLEGDPANGWFTISTGVGVTTSGELDPTQITPGVHALTYIYTDMNGCTDVASKNIRIFNLHNVTLTGLEPEYCRLDDPAVLTGLPYGGDYSGGTTTNVFTPNVIGNFTVTYTHDSMRVAYQDTVYCVNEAALSTTVHALPEIDIAAGYQLTPWGAIETCQPDTVIMNAGPGYTTYGWNTFDSVQTITSTGYGEYAVTVTNIHGCKGLDDLYIGGTDVMLEKHLSPLSNCTLSGSEPLILQYKNVATRVFAPTDKISFYAKFGNANSSTIFDSRVVDFNPGDSLTFEIPSVDSLSNIGVVGEYYILAYLHFEESSGEYPDCQLENDTLHITVVHAGLPEVDLGPDIESGIPDSIEIDAGVFETYQWNTGATTQSIMAMPTTFTYVVTITDIYGCEASDDVTITLISIDELAQSYQSMNVYPNPSNGEFTLHVENKTFADISYEIVDINGRVISTSQTHGSRELIENISMKNNSKGVYFLKVFNGEHYAIQKIVIQ